ncbi:hypothetical protein HN51_015065 [Arachis hypogaea]
MDACVVVAMVEGTPKVETQSSVFHSLHKDPLFPEYHHFENYGNNRDNKASLILHQNMNRQKGKGFFPHSYCCCRLYSVADVHNNMTGKDMNPHGNSSNLDSSTIQYYLLQEMLLEPHH